MLAKEGMEEEEEKKGKCCCIRCFASKVDPRRMGVRKDQRIFRQRGRRRVKQRQLLLALREPLLRALWYHVDASETAFRLRALGEIKLISIDYSYCSLLLFHDTSRYFHYICDTKILIQPRYLSIWFFLTYINNIKFPSWILLKCIKNFVCLML